MRLRYKVRKLVFTLLLLFALSIVERLLWQADKEESFDNEHLPVAYEQIQSAARSFPRVQDKGNKKKSARILIWTTYYGNKDVMEHIQGACT